MMERNQTHRRNLFRYEPWSLCPVFVSFLVSTFDLFPDERRVVMINRHFTSARQDVFPATLVSQFKYTCINH